MNAVKASRISNRNRAVSEQRSSARRPLPDIRHIVLPFAVQASAAPIERERIADFLVRVGWSTDRLPTILVINGKPVLRRFWKRRRIKSDDRVEFWSRPWGGAQGGSGKQIIGIVALIALAAFAPYIAGPAGLNLVAGSFGFNAVVGAITIGGGISTLALLAPTFSGLSRT